VAATKGADEPAGGQFIRSDAALSGILALLAADRDDRLRESNNGDRRKTELVLADAGLTAGEIGKVLNKKANSVSKTIQRARAKDAVSTSEEAS